MSPRGVTASSHMEDLRKSGLNSETIAKAGIYSATAEEVQQLVGLPAGPGLVFPYGGDYAQVKPDKPWATSDCKLAKYLSPRQRPKRLYLPPLLDEAVFADAKVPLWVTEGEKKALKAVQEGLACIAVSGVDGWRRRERPGDPGTPSVPLPDLDLVTWRGRRVYLCYDSDAVTKEQVQRAEWTLAAELERRGAKVIIVRLPGGQGATKVGLDDYLCHHGVGELLALADTTAWPDPQPVGDAILPVPPFDPAQMLPEPFASWVLDVVDRAQCPPDFVAVPLLCALAAVVGRKVAIRPKLHDEWTVIPNLWGMIVGEPGVMKTPAMQEALKFLKRLEVDARQDFAAREAAYQAQMELYEAQLRAWKDDLKKATAKHEPTDDLMANQPLEPEEPVARRYIVNDTTVEKIGELLNQNPNGLLIVRDEMIGFLRSMDRDGHENDRSFYNVAWEGSQSYTYDRIQRGTVIIEHACVSLVGGIQPGPLREYLNEVVGGGGLDDGFIQRMQLMVWPNVNRAWQNVDRWPDTGAKHLVYEVFRRLDQLSAEAMGARVDPDSSESPPFLQFTPEAQGVFDAWRTNLERRARADGAEYPAIVNHLSKYRSLMPSLALLFHLANPEPWAAAGPPHKQVSVSAAQCAVAWCAYLEAHARRVYQSVTRRTESGAARLAQCIKRGRLKDPFTVYQVKRQGWGGLRENKDIIEALTLLEELGWVRPVARPSSTHGGRPTVEYRLNPQLGLQG